MESVHILFYEDKHGSDITVFADEHALQEQQLRMMMRPDREFAGKVEFPEEKHQLVKDLIDSTQFETAWELFNQHLSEWCSIYLRVEVRNVVQAEWVSNTRTGRLRSDRPNLANRPK